MDFCCALDLRFFFHGWLGKLQVKCFNNVISVCANNCLRGFVDI